MRRANQRATSCSVVSSNPRLDVADISYSEYLAYLSQKKRADERTRTADLLITSALSCFHRCFQRFQKPLTEAMFTCSAFLDVPGRSLRLLSRLLSDRSVRLLPLGDGETSSGVGT